MKKIVAILCICCLTCHLHAQQVSYSHVDLGIPGPDSLLYQGKHSDSLSVIIGQCITPVIFDVDKYHIKPTPQLDKTIDSIKNIQNRLTYIWIAGSASPEGSLKWNQRLGQYRAEALANYISMETGLKGNMLRVNNLGEDWSSLNEILKHAIDFPNRESLLEILSKEQDNEIRKRKIQNLDGGKTWRQLIDNIFPPLRNARLALISVYPLPTPIAPHITLKKTPITLSRHDKLPLSIHTSTPIYDKTPKSNWKIAVKTNLLFDAALVANLGVEISPGTHWSIDIPFWYSPYSINSTRQIRLLATQPEIRWWPQKAMQGHFIGIHTHVAGFNIALNDYARYQDPNHALWGLGLSYGYAMTLGQSEHWGLEFNIGAGFVKYRYDAYRNWNNGPKFKSGSDWYWGITRAGITLSYKWNLSRRNNTN